MTIEKLWNYFDSFITNTIDYTPRIFLAIIVLIGGFWIIGRITQTLTRALQHKKIELSLVQFMSTFLKIVLRILLIISAATILGIETTSFVAMIGAAGLAVGLALQGSLANFAGGVLILIFKPFKVGDRIKVNDFEGDVIELHIFNTILRTIDEKIIILPNGTVSNGAITNLTKQGFVRLDINVGIGYESDIKKAREVILHVVKAHKNVKSDPESKVAVAELGDSSVNLLVMCPVDINDYWDTHFDLLESIKDALDEHSINIPFPQRVVHMQQ